MRQRKPTRCSGLILRSSNPNRRLQLTTLWQAVSTTCYGEVVLTELHYEASVGERVLSVRLFVELNCLIRSLNNLLTQGFRLEYFEFRSKRQCELASHLFYIEAN